MTLGVAAATLAVLAVALWPGRPPSRSPSRSPERSPRSPRSSGSSRGLGGSASTSRLAARLRPRRSAHGQAPVDQVADTLVLLALALRAGLGLVEALDEVRPGAGDEVARDLSAVVAALRWGRTAREAWSYAGDVWRPAELAWVVADETGAAPASLVEQAALRLREELERDRERRASRAGVLLVLPLGLGFLPAFACTAVVPVVLALARTVIEGSR
ncbi:type II secretion system F family protein [Phycicoccus sp. Soil748]|uniref:type II secretion system F family protein n=1 Tax=Phycicoccus sp. Soil748 TaxID=1736397 RepID=UPI000702E78B|nr:type II secretion system F family protein [Phycicoccus sp. Soil748]KRE56382.1 hypothetical protein ASG70_04450 [Phycicoccus sp. Soil748]